MDMRMNAERFSASVHPIWDVKVEGGIVPILSGRDEQQQQAVLAGFLEKGTIPLLPEAGTPWTDFLTRKISFGELDSAVRESLRLAGADRYEPQYEIDGDRLTMSIGEIRNETD